MADDVDVVGHRQLVRDVAAHGVHAGGVARGVAVERAQDAVEPLARTCVVARPHEAQHLVARAFEQPRKHLHAEEAGGARQEDPRSDFIPAHFAAASASSGRCAVPSMPSIGVPIAWKPPSTWRISPVVARARSESR